MITGSEAVPGNHRDFPPSSAPHAPPTLVGIAALLIIPYLALSGSGPLGPDFPRVLACLGAAFAVYWAGCVEGHFRLTGLQVLMIGLAARLLLLPMPASDDMHRYLWEGKILGLGFNPYALAPLAPALEPFRDANWAKVNHPDIAAIYPPMAQALFFLLAKAGGSELPFKCAFVVFDVLAYGALMAILRGRTAAADGVEAEARRKLALRIGAVYFLNPLLIFEIAGRGHFDSLPVFLNLLFLWSLSARKTWAPAILGFGILAKISSLALFPLLLFHLSRNRAAAWSAGLCVFITAVLWSVGGLSSLGKFATEFRFNAAIPSLIDAVLPFVGGTERRVLTLMTFAAAGLAGLRWLRNAPLEHQALWFMGMLLLFSPTLHPWYLLWALPFAAMAQSRPWLLLTGTVMITYAVYGQAHATGQWREIHWLRLPEYLPPLFLYLYLAWKRKSFRP